jgi:Questin oxidase-like
MTTTTATPTSSKTTSTTQRSGILMRPVARTLLADRQYHIEFHGFLSNHAKHAVIALDRLSAPEERVQENWDDYTKMSPYGITLEKVEQPNWDYTPTATSSWSNKWNDRTWRGKKIAWQEQVVFMNQELEQRFHHDTNQLVHFYAPDLIVSGVAGSLTHGIIHLGWAIDAKSPWMIAEGLAYLNFGHLGVDPNLLSWPKEDAGATAIDNEKEIESIMDSLIRVANIYESENLKSTWIDRVKAELNDTTNFHPELVCAGFQWELSKILSQPHAVATQMPSWLTLPSSSSSSQTNDEDDDEKLWREMYVAIVYLYLATRSPDPQAAATKGEGEDVETYGNFLVLHLITSLWGLEHTIKAIAAGGKGDDNNNHDDNSNASSIDMRTLTRKALGQFYATVICMLATSASGFPSASALKDIQQEFPTTTTSWNDDDDNVVDWEPTVRRGIAEQEEHNFKLVYVMKELWNRHNHWNGFYQAANAFTLTPIIGPTSRQ